MLNACFENHAEVQSLTVSLTRPKALLQPASIELSSSRSRGATESLELLFIYNLATFPIVGINACEREQTQLVRFDISMQRSTHGYSADAVFPFRELALNLVNVCDQYPYIQYTRSHERRRLWTRRRSSR